MKNEEMRDERIVAARRKIQSDGYRLLVLFLMLALIVQLMMKAPPVQYVGELLGLIGCGLYMTVRHLRMGIDLWSSPALRGGALIKNALIGALFAAVLLYLFVGERSLANLALMVVCYTTFTVLTYALLRFLSRRRQQKLLDRLDAEECDD